MATIVRISGSRFDGASLAVKMPARDAARFEAGPDGSIIFVAHEGEPRKVRLTGIQREHSDADNTLFEFVDVK